MRVARNYSYMHQPTLRRFVWVTFSRICTFMFPDFLLHHVGRMKTPAARQDWREKIASFILFLAASGFFCFWLEYISTFFCESAKTIEYDQVFNNHSSYAAINGKAVNWSKYAASSEIAETVSQYAGYDLSPMFPTFMLLKRNNLYDTYEDHTIQACIGDMNKSTQADNWLNHKLSEDPGYVFENNQLISCPLPNQTNITGAPCVYKASDIKEVNQFGYKGDIVFDPDELVNATRLPTANYPGQAYVILDDQVLDVTSYLETATNVVRVSAGMNSRAFALDRMFLPLDLTIYLFINLGKDISQYFDGNVSGDATIDDTYRACLKTLFFKGIVPTAIPTGCLRINPALWATMGAGLVYFLLKMNLANLSRLKFVQRFLFASNHEFSSIGPFAWPYTILLIPCYAESPDTIKQTLDTLARTSYEDSRKLLLFVCDGLVKSKYDVKETHVCILEALGYSSTEEPISRAYVSLGQNRRKINCAKVYSGFYETGRNRVPFMVVVKVGNAREASGTRVPGNRGKRDSMVLVLGFLERCMNLASNRMTPLEYELFNQSYNVLGLDPRNFKYMLLTDADTQVQSDVVQKMVTRLENDRSMLAISGHIRPANPEENFVTMLQIFPLYLTMFSSLAYEACMGSVITVNGGCVMYKLWTENLVPVGQDRPLFVPYKHVSTSSTLKEPPSTKWPKVSDEFQPNNNTWDVASSSSSMSSTSRRDRRDSTTTTVESYISLSPKNNVRPCCIHPTVLRGFATPQADTLHMKNVLLLGEEQFFGIVLLRSHPHHRLGFEPEAIAYSTIPTNLFALQGLQSRNMRAAFHNQLEMQRVAWQLGFTYWLLSTTKLLDMILSIPIIVYLYGCYVRFIANYGMAYTIIAISFGCLIVLYVIFFILRRQFKYLIWFTIYCLVSVPLFTVWFPLVALWSADYAESWYDVWPTTKGLGGRLHGIIDDVDPDNNPEEGKDEEEKPAEEEVVHRLNLSEFDQLEARRAYNRAIEEEAALDANFVGFTGFGGKEESRPHSFVSQGSAEHLSDGHNKALTSSQIKEYSSLRMRRAPPSYAPINTSTISKRSKHRPNHSDYPDAELLPPSNFAGNVSSFMYPDTDPFSDHNIASENPFDDRNETTYPVDDSMINHLHGSRHKASHSQSSYFSNHSRTTQLNDQSTSYYASGMFVPDNGGSTIPSSLNSSSGFHPLTHGHNRSYSSGFGPLNHCDSNEDRNSTYSNHSNSISLAGSYWSLDPEASFEPESYASGGPRHLMSRDDSRSGSSRGPGIDLREGRSVAVHSRVGLTIPLAERSKGHFRNPPVPQRAVIAPLRLRDLPRMASSSSILQPRPNEYTLPHTNIQKETKSAVEKANILQFVRQEIYEYLQHADLDSITRAQVKEHLSRVFGSSIDLEDEEFQEFIHASIEDTTLAILTCS
ncbi:chitin synthase-domain-containing protein [Phycomyces blakesleeanus]|uniref:chitin synthase n=1 Tax=Phycomyces blakesleeanus TaxID=4837 RepID=A0ABR3AR48_PHYBL